MPTLQKGATFAEETLQPSKLNRLVDEATIHFASGDKLCGRTSGAGPAEDIPCTAAARTLLAAATAADQRSALGLGSAATQSAEGARLAHDSYVANTDEITYGASVAVDFAPTIRSAQTINLAGNLTLTTSNLASGRVKLLRLVGDGSTRTLTFPAGWKFLGAARPTNLAAGKVAELRLMAWGTVDGAVHAIYVPEP